MSITIFSTSHPYWRIILGVLAITSTILSSLSKQLGAGERAQLHCTMVRHYNSIINELNIFIHMKSATPEERRTFAERIRQHMNKLFDMQPEPSVWAIRDYERRYKTYIETALFDDIETAALHSASYVEKRLSRVKAPSLVAQTNGSTNLVGSSGRATNTV